MAKSGRRCDVNYTDDRVYNWTCRWRTWVCSSVRLPRTRWQSIRVLTTVARGLRSTSTRLSVAGRSVGRSAGSWVEPTSRRHSVQTPPRPTAGGWWRGQGELGSPSSPSRVDRRPASSTLVRSCRTGSRRPTFVSSCTASARTRTWTRRPWKARPASTTRCRTLLSADAASATVTLRSAAQSPRCLEEDRRGVDGPGVAPGRHAIAPAARTHNCSWRVSVVTTRQESTVSDANRFTTIDRGHALLKTTPTSASVTLFFWNFFCFKHPRFHTLLIKCHCMYSMLIDAIFLIR